MKLNNRKVIFLIAAGSFMVTSCALPLTSCSWSKGSLVRLVTDSGPITDQSFNESAYDSLADISNASAPGQKHWYQPDGNSANVIANGYRAAEATGAKYILAPGFYHVAAIHSYVKGQKDTNLKWILADADGSLDSPAGHKEVGNRVSGIIFDMKSTSYVAGFYSAYRAQEFDKPMVGTYGGGNFPGVTDYNLGWLAGVKGANTFNAQQKNGTWKPVKVATFINATEWTNAGFDNQQLAHSKTKTLLSKGANVFLPVAGADTLGTLSEMKEEGSKGLVLGVDTDMELKFPTFKDQFFTSILKNLTYAMDAIYLKDVENINKVDKNSTNRAAKGMFKRFGDQANFVNKDKVIDFTNANIQPFGTNTFGTISNHFTGMAKLHWGNTASPETLKTAIAFLNSVNTVEKNGNTKWENDWATNHKSAKSGLTWDNFLNLSVLKNWDGEL